MDRGLNSRVRILHTLRRGKAKRRKEDANGFGYIYSSRAGCLNPNNIADRTGVVRSIGTLELCRTALLGTTASEMHQVSRSYFSFVV